MAVKPVFSMDDMSRLLADIDRAPPAAAEPPRPAPQPPSSSGQSHITPVYHPSPDQIRREQELHRAQDTYDRAEQRLERENGEAANEAFSRADGRLQRARDDAGHY